MAGAVALNRMSAFAHLRFKTIFLVPRVCVSVTKDSAVGILPAFLLGLYAGSLADDLTQALANESTKVEGLKKESALALAWRARYTFRWVLKTWKQAERKTHS